MKPPKPLPLSHPSESMIGALALEQLGLPAIGKGSRKLLKRLIGFLKPEHWVRYQTTIRISRKAVDALSRRDPSVLRPHAGETAEDAMRRLDLPFLY